MNASIEAALVRNHLAPVLPAAPVLASAPDVARTRTTFDGIICFGGVDWWYHNRGHYDLQMMRELSGSIPVLYVNSIGMRLASGGSPAQFWTRVRRKLASVARGRVQVREGMTVFSPLSPPVRVGRSFLRRALAWQVRSAAEQLGIHRPLVWIACPPAAEVLDSLDPRAVIYQRTDRFEEYPGVDRKRITALDQALKRRAELTLFCSSLLMDEEGTGCRHALFVDHGVDFEVFKQAGMAATTPPALKHVGSPRIGYVGNLEPHRVDQRLLAQVARKLTDYQFVIVGPGPLAPEISSLPNVHRFPQQSYEQVPAFMAACDVLIMPWNENPWIQACNPVKLKEYLAVGRPVVSTPFEELRHYKEVVRIASGAGDFAAKIQSAVEHPGDLFALRNRVRKETWAAKADIVVNALGQQAVHHHRG